MKTKTTFSRLLLLMLACVMTTMASADNYFTIDSRYIPANKLGTDIVVPVKANFSSRVSCWEVQFVLPEGMTLVNTTGGHFQFGYDYYGPGMADPHVSYSEDFSHVAAFAYGINRDYDFQAQQWTTRWSAFWSPYLHQDMLLLTIHIDESFTGGDIQVISKGLIGYDPHTPDAFTPITINNEDFGGYVPGDADGNNSVFATDIDYILNYVTGADTTSLNTVASDVNQDGTIDILDLEMIWDKYLFEEWFEGYTVWEKTSTATFTISSPVSDNNYFYIDDLTISTNDVGQRITVPVKASFDSYVSSWSLQFSLPQGLVPLYLRNGSDMNVAYCNEDGEEGTFLATMAHHVNQDDNTLICIGSNFGMDYQLNEFGDYEYCGSIKWAPGQFDEILLLTFKVDETFEGGDIVINTQTTCGYDSRNESNTVYPSTMEYGDGYYPGDVNCDGTVTIADLTALVDYMMDPEANSQNISFSSGEVVFDGAINIMDLNKLLDYLLTGEWYDGYYMTQAENIFTIPGLILSGDVNGDGRVSLADVVVLIDYLLFTEQGFYDADADVNGDGRITIGDVSVIIDIMINQ